VGAACRQSPRTELDRTAGCVWRRRNLPGVRVCGVPAAHGNFCDWTAVVSQLGKLLGYGWLVLSLPALLTLWSVPDVRGALPPGGVLGTLAADGLRAA